MEIDHATAPLQRLEHDLNNFATFCVLPLFALAKAGILVASLSAGALGYLLLRLVLRR
ncbi:MAG: Na+/H+ antiporter NhaA [Deltaproteobacteria bacterium]|nr:Na+/H+ antiporter NhaA [Deltaproteobacteria bacterium]